MKLSIIFNNNRVKFFIIKVFGHSNKRVAKIGNKVVIVISPIKELYFFQIKLEDLKLFLLRLKTFEKLNIYCNMFIEVGRTYINMSISFLLIGRG